MTTLPYVVSRCCAGGAEDPPRQPLELWVADAASGAARCLLRSPELGLNAIFDECATLNADGSLSGLKLHGAEMSCSSQDLYNNASGR